MIRMRCCFKNLQISNVDDVSNIVLIILKILLSLQPWRYCIDVGWIVVSYGWMDAIRYHYNLPMRGKKEL